MARVGEIRIGGFVADITVPDLGSGMAIQVRMTGSEAG
jgi:hypothetical protein